MSSGMRWMALACLVALAACGGGGGGGGSGGSGGDGAGTSGVFTVTDTGSAPRITLGVGTSRTSLLSVEASASESINLDGVVTDDNVSASLELVAELSADDNGGAALNLIPVLQAYSPLSDVASEVVPGAWERVYDANGVLVDATTSDRDGVFGTQSLGLFLIPALLLSAPDTPVGAGASWVSESALQAGVMRHTTRLIAVNERELRVETRSQFVPGDAAASASQSTVVLALYDRDSMLIRSGEVESMARFSGTVSRNGAETEVIRTRSHRHVFSEVQP